MHTIISLGGGVQSTLMALSITKKYKMPELSELLPNPIIIMADTGSERPETMTYFKKYVRPQLIKDNIDFYVIRTKLGKLHEWYTKNSKIPFRVYRECTDKFKIQPIKSKIKQLGLYQKRGDKVTQALGITTDEIQRVKPNRTTWINNIYPLIDIDYSRQDCINWYETHNLPVPIKSGCFCCPFQKKSEWIKLYQKHPQLIDLSIKMEQRAIKQNHNQSNYKISLVDNNTTLTQLIQNQKNQLSLDLFFDEYSSNDECSGSCFT